MYIYGLMSAYKDLPLSLHMQTYVYIYGLTVKSAYSAYKNLWLSLHMHMRT